MTRRRYSASIVNFEHMSHLFLVFLSLTLKMYLLAGKYSQIRHHLQTRPGPRPRPSKNRTLILRTLEKTGPCNLVETKDQIEYISRCSNSAKSKDQNSNIPRKAGSYELPNHF